MWKLAFAMAVVVGVSFADLGPRPTQVDCQTVGTDSKTGAIDLTKLNQKYSDDQRKNAVDDVKSVSVTALAGGKYLVCRAATPGRPQAEEEAPGN